MSPPYYEDADTVLYLGDMRQVMPQLDVTADCVVADEKAVEW